MFSNHHMSYMLAPFSEARGVVTYLTHRARLLHLDKETLRSGKIRRQLPNPPRDQRDMPKIWESTHSYGSLPAWTLYEADKTLPIDYPYPVVSYTIGVSSFEPPPAGWEFDKINFYADRFLFIFFAFVFSSGTPKPQPQPSPTLSTQPSAYGH